MKLTTEKWLELNEIPYDRLLFDRPDYPVFINETPSRTHYQEHTIKDTLSRKHYQGNTIKVTLSR